MRPTTVKKLTSDPALPPHQVERVVAADRVNATAVYSRAGVALGTVDRLMIDKISGRIAYAVIAIGGGDRHQALPWSALNYDPQLGGYLVNFDHKMLENERGLEPAAARLLPRSSLLDLKRHEVPAVRR